MHRGKTAATVGSIGSTLEIVQKKAAAAESNSNGGLPTAHPRKVSQKKAAPGGSVGGLPATHPSRGAAFTASSGKMPQKKATSSPHGVKEATSRLRCSGTAAIKDIGSVSRSNIPQKKLHKVDKADTGLSGGGMLRKKSSKLEADTRRVAEELQDAKLLIQELNKLGRGEDISREDFLPYYDQLPSGPPWIDTRVELEYGKLNEQQLLHALYRFRYCKHQLSQKVCKKELEEDCPLYRFGRGSGRLKEDDLQDITEEGCSVEFRKEQGYFKHFEEDGTLDWCFHPDYLDCDALNDYQRLVLRNYGDTEYARWSEYHKYLHTYTIEQEYVKYCEVLSKELEWIKDYIHFDRPSFKWDHISSRGALQAVKIAATCFTKISATLAYSGYYECIESISYHHVWFEELDGVYFQICLRVTRGLSFKDAIAEVHHLNMFPLRQYMMKRALEFDYSMEKMEEQYRTCTASIISEVEEDQALKLIGEAVKKLFNKPKSYEQYIRKKIHIASVIGIPLVV